MTSFLAFLWFPIYILYLFVLILTEPEGEDSEQ